MTDPLEPSPVDPFPPTPSDTPSWVRYAAKFIWAVAGIVALALTQGLIEGTAAKWAAVIISVVTAGGVYTIPNTPSEGVGGGF